MKANRNSAPEQRVAVIGAGISGLATAALLGREGYQVTLFEALPRTGGRAGSWSSEGFRFDLGPSWYLMPEVFEHFYRLLGTSTEEQLELVRLDPGYQVFFEEQQEALRIRASRQANQDLFESIEPGAGAALGRYLEAAEETYRVALGSFLYTNFASPGSFFSQDVLKHAGTMLPLLMKSLDQHIRSSFGDERLRRILGYPAVFLGASPMLAPALYQLMSHLDLESGIDYPLGGFTEIIGSIENLARAQNVRIRTGTEITEITTTSGRKPSVTGVHYREADGSIHHHSAEIVVSAADLHHTETALLPEALRSYPESWWQRKIPGPGAVLVYLGVRGSLPELEHHNLLFVREWNQNFSAIFDAAEGEAFVDPASLYVCRPSASDPSVAPEGHENLFLLIPVPADSGFGAGGLNGGGDRRVEELADAAIRQLADWSGCHDLADRIVLRRTSGPADFARDYGSWSGSALGPAHTLRQSAFLRGRNASAKVAGLFYAGATTVPGVGLPMCLISAELVVKRLRGETSAQPLPEPL